DEQSHYLVERFSVSYLTTGRDLLRLEAPRQSKTPPVLVANPVFDEPGKLLARAEKPALGAATNGRRSITSGQKLSDVYFAPLTGTEREAHAIQALFPDARMLAGTEATKAALEQVNAPEILHIATHGFFLEDQGAAAPTSANSGVATGELENPLMRSGLAL